VPEGVPFLGEAAALGTALLWAVGTLLFTTASRRVGPFAVNLTRINLACLILIALVLITRSPWQGVLTTERMGILFLSGWIGLVLGDWALFTAFVMIGPRLATLMMALAPPMAALLAMPLLGESLGPLAYGGMALTIGGVAWVILERSPTPIPRGHRILGVLLALLGAAGQAAGLVLSKLGMDGEVSPLTATALRMSAAVIGVWLVAAFSGRTREPFRLRSDRLATLAILGATLVGPVFGIWLSLIAVKNIEAGVAATLMAPVPVFVLPLVHWVYKEKVTHRAIVGAVLAVIGVAVLMLRGSPG
jgi:drug/metabolite transporter (DMT)-like permease